MPRNTSQGDVLSSFTQGLGKLSLVDASSAQATPTVVQAGTKKVTAKKYRDRITRYTIQDWIEKTKGGISGDENGGSSNQTHAVPAVTEDSKKMNLPFELEAPAECSSSAQKCTHKIIREVPIVGGTGGFRFARGYMTFETVHIGGEAHLVVIQCNITGQHY